MVFGFKKRLTGREKLRRIHKSRLNLQRAVNKRIKARLGRIKQQLLLADERGRLRIEIKKLDVFELRVFSKVFNKRIASSSILELKRRGLKLKR